MKLNHAACLLLFSMPTTPGAAIGSDGKSMTSLQERSIASEAVVDTIDEQPFAASETTTKRVLLTQEQLEDFYSGGDGEGTGSTTTQPPEDHIPDEDDPTSDTDYWDHYAMMSVPTLPPTNHPSPYPIPYPIPEPPKPPTPYPTEKPPTPYPVAPFNPPTYYPPGK